MMGDTNGDTAGDMKGDMMGQKSMMRQTRQALDDYLDGALSAAERAELEGRLAGDGALAALLARLRGERALRVAAINAFQPGAAEAGQMAARVLAACDGGVPAGYVGRWLRRGAAAAAVVALVAGSFALGRTTAARSVPAPMAAKAEPQVIYRVMYYGDNGDVQVREFASVDDANEFINKPEIRRSGEPQVAAVDLTRPGSF